MVRLPSYCERIMETVKLSSKGQVVIPKAIRDACHFHIGEEFIVTVVGGEIRLRPAAGSVKRTTLDEVAGMLHRTGAKPLNDEEADRRIEAMLGAEDAATKAIRKRA